jgi:hypothetical protein
MADLRVIAARFLISNATLDAILPNKRHFLATIHYILNQEMVGDCKQRLADAIKVSLWESFIIIVDGRIGRETEAGTRSS